MENLDKDIWGFLIQFLQLSINRPSIRLFFFMLTYKDLSFLKKLIILLLKKLGTWAIISLFPQNKSLK